jgi:hypothetical protein
VLVLPRDLIFMVHQAAITAGLDRETLLQGIDRGFVRSLPNAPNAAAQLLSDIEELNRAGALADATVPLRLWLESAVALAGPRQEAEVFRRALQAHPGKLHAAPVAPSSAAPSYALTAPPAPGRRGKMPLEPELVSQGVYQEDHAQKYKHVFVSFSDASDADVNFASRVIDEIESAGMKTWWIDDEGHPSGTIGWEDAIRNAIASSFAVVFIASPHSRQSSYVRAELSLARAANCTIYPLWSDGDEWIDCVPFDLASAQRIDCRENNFAHGMDRLIQLLRKRIASALPAHCLVPDTARTERHSLPAGCLSIDVPRQTSMTFDRRIQINLLAYGSLQEMMDTVYMSYLTELFEPYTYGNQWVLVARESSLGCGVRQIAVPRGWLVSRSLEAGWSARCSMTDLGLFPGTRWIVHHPAEVRALGIAMRWNIFALPPATRAKTLLFQFRSKTRWQPVSRVDPSVYPFLLVVTSDERDLSYPDGTVLVLPEDH